jgi:hypothetical protein
MKQSGVRFGKYISISSSMDCATMLRGNWTKVAADIMVESGSIRVAYWTQWLFDIMELRSKTEGLTFTVMASIRMALAGAFACIHYLELR